jgi:alkaline phosphatase D
MSVSYDAVNAYFFGLPQIGTRSGENRLARTNGVAAVGGVAESGSLKGGKILGKNDTNDTAMGRYFTSNLKLYATTEK